jgi:hypothetical protein
MNARNKKIEQIGQDTLKHIEESIKKNNLNKIEALGLVLSISTNLLSVEIAPYNNSLRKNVIQQFICSIKSQLNKIDSIRQSNDR